LKNLSLAFFLLTATTTAAQAACLDAQEVQRAVYDQFKVELLQDEKNPQAVDLCDEKSLPYRVFSSILFLKSLPTLERREGDAFDLGRLGPNAYDFFRARAKILSLDLRPKSHRETSCSDNRAAFVPPGGESDGSVIACMNLADPRRSIFWAASILVHEAWHLNKEDPGHVRCVAGPFIDGNSCDASFEEGGSYAVGIEFAVRVSRQAGLDSKLRTEARNMALSDFLVRFNRKSFDIRDGALLEDEKGQYSFYDGESQRSLSLNVESGAVALSRVGIATFLQPESAKASGYYYKRGRVTDVPPSPYVNFMDIFRNELNASERASVRDAFFGGKYACLLMDQALECMDPGRQRFRVPFTHLVPRNFLSTFKSRFVPANVAHIYGEDGFLYILPDSVEDLKNTDPKNWRRSNTPYAFQYLSSFTYGYEIALTAEGKVALYSYPDRKWIQAPKGLEDKKYKRLIAPFAWSEKLNEL
jgi:hypothetical protein